MPVKLSVIIPVFNEAGNIGPLVTEVRRAIGPENELIVVDDGSTDGTINELDPYTCTILRHDANKGKGAAMRTGIHAASGDVLVFMGGDGQDDPMEIHKLMEAIDRGADFVIGSRFLSNHCPDLDDTKMQKRFSTDAVRPINEIGNKGLTALINILFGIHITDSQAEFKCIRASKLRSLNLESNRYEIETEILIRAARSGLKIVEVPVHRYPRAHGMSKLYQIPLGRFKFGLRFLRTIIKGYFLWR
jgi:glycosyltransferase involved in cell wall biosynthesis